MKPVWPTVPLSRWFKRLLKTLSLFIATVFLVTGLAVPGHSALQPATLTPNAAETGLDTLLAQEPNTTGNATLYFQTPTFTVSVFPRNVPQLMNVYNKDTRQAEQLNAPVVFRGSINNDGWVSYDSFGSRNGRNVIYRASGNRDTSQARLEVIDAATNSVVLSQNSTSIAALNVPAVNGGSGQNDLLAGTFVGFETQNYSTRVFNDDGVTKLNVYSKASGQALVNGQPATAEAAVGPYECWVNYFGGQSFGGAAARYFVRVSGDGQARLEVIGANGSVLLSEPRISSAPLVTNIPQADRPACFGDSGTVSDSLAPYVAAVFGDENDLEQVRQVLSSASGGRGVGGLTCAINPEFESARQGRFINAAECNDRNDASAVVNFLRGRGFNSRLVYRSVRYR